MSRDISNSKNYRDYSNQALKIEELEVEFRLLWIRNKQNQRELNKHWIKGQTDGSGRAADTHVKKQDIADTHIKERTQAMGSDATSTWFCSFSKGATRTKAAAQDSSETARASLGKDRNGISIYIRSKVELISKSKSVTAHLYGLEKGVAIRFDNQGWVEVEAYVKGERKVGSRKQNNLRVIE
jgi:hypothetical protein